MTDTNAMREAVAKAAYESHCARNKPWQLLSLFEKDRWRASADAILALLATDRAAGVGEPTGAMLVCDQTGGRMFTCWPVPHLKKQRAEEIYSDTGGYRTIPLYAAASPPALLMTTDTGFTGYMAMIVDETGKVLAASGDPVDQAMIDHMLNVASPAPADASDFSPHRWTEIVSNGLGANNAGCWRCGALSEVLARVLSLSGHDAKVIQGKANGEDHVWVQIGDTVYDPTVGQFQEPVSYQMDQVAPADASGEVQSDSADYEHTFYGIINGQGEFWSPLPFHDEATARARLERYAQGPNASMLDTHKIVPVRIVLTALDPKRQEPRP